MWRVTWEAREQEPVLGGLTYTFTPTFYKGPYWIEAEIQWPDGRRAFATNTVSVGDADLPAPPQLSGARTGLNAFSFDVTGRPWATCVIEASNDLATWQPVLTNALSADGMASFSVPRLTQPGERYYRAALPQ